MTSEPDTWAAELDSVGASDDQFLNERRVIKTAVDGEKDGFDGWDSNWYWDNDFDCLSVSDDNPTEMISVVICSDDEMVSVVYGDDSHPLEDVSCVQQPPTEASGMNRDLSNEDYLKHFEQKFSQPATDFGYNISSVSSSLSSTPDSSLHLVPQTEVNPELWLMQEKRRPNGTEHQQLTTPPSSLTAASAASASEKLSTADQRVRAVDGSGCCKDDVDDYAVAERQIPKEPLLGIAQTDKDKKDRKRKVRKKTSKVSSSSKTEKSQRQSVDEEASVELRTRTESSFHLEDTDNRLIGNKVLAVFGFSAVLGIVSGLLIGYLATQRFAPPENVADGREPEFHCPRPICQSGHQMILNSVWANKYEDLVMENAELHLKLTQLKQTFSFELFQAQRTVDAMRRDVAEIRNDFGELQRFSESECQLYATDIALPPHDSLFSALSSLAVCHSWGSSV